MNPIEFEGRTNLLLRPDNMTEDECGNLPIFTDNKFCVSCWKPTIRERLSILLFGKVWLWVYSGSTQPPVAIEARKTILE